MSSVWSRHIGHIGGPPVSLAYTISFHVAQGQILQTCAFPCTLLAVYGLHGIMRKCTTATFFAFGGLTLCWCYIIVLSTEVNLAIVNVLADFR